jgi:hypothetical protein
MVIGAAAVEKGIAAALGGDEVVKQVDEKGCV